VMRASERPSIAEGRRLGPLPFNCPGLVAHCRCRSRHSRMAQGMRQSARCSDRTSARCEIFALIARQRNCQNCEQTQNPSARPRKAQLRTGRGAASAFPAAARGGFGIGPASALATTSIFSARQSEYPAARIIRPDARVHWQAREFRDRASVSSRWPSTAPSSVATAGSRPSNPRRPAWRRKETNTRPTAPSSGRSILGRYPCAITHLRPRLRSISGSVLGAAAAEVVPSPSTAHSLPPA